MTVNYIAFKDLPTDIKSASKSAVKIYSVVSELNKEIDVEREKLGKYTSLIKDYLGRVNMPGIDVNGENLIYTQGITRVPSFKMVLDVVRNEIPKEVVDRLEQTYKTLTASDSVCVKIK